jgi:DNA topoisomerase 2-associated protein PAT1
MEGRSSSNIGEDSTAAGLGAAATSLSSSLNQSSASRAALNKRQVLIALERVYDIVLQLEQSRRVQPSLAAHAAGETQASEGHGNPPDFPQHARIALQENEAQYAALALDISSPHPFISLLSATKGKKLLPRALRHTDPQQTLTLLTLLVATFDTLDVVRDAHVLDMNPSDPLFNATAASYAPGRPSRLEAEASTETFLNATIPLVMGTIGRAPLRIVTGMMGLLIERNDLLKVAKTKVGLPRRLCSHPLFKKLMSSAVVQ